MQALDIIAACCRALIDAHAAGVVHKDIKPRNIVFNPTTGEVQLIDFGVFLLFVVEGTFVARGGSGVRVVGLDVWRRRVIACGWTAWCDELLLAWLEVLLVDRGRYRYDVGV